MKQLASQGFIDRLLADVVAARLNTNEAIIESLNNSLSAFPTLEIQECRQRCDLKF